VPDAVSQKALRQGFGSSLVSESTGPADEHHGRDAAVVGEPVRRVDNWADSVEGAT
jgi:hypothetical protein